MSNDTGWKAKISSITDRLGLTSTAPKTAKAAKISDTYAVHKKPGYKKLVEGRMHPARYEALQDIMNSMIPNRKEEAEEYIIDIPHIVDVFKQSPFQHRDMEPVVERYAGLEKALLAQMAEIKQYLHPDYMSEFTSGQIANLQDRLEKVGERLRFCREQLEQANIYLEWQKQDELVAWKKEQAEMAGDDPDLVSSDAGYIGNKS